MKYNEPKEGEWIFPIMNGYKLSCCDCGLVHKVDFNVVDLESIEFRMFRDNRATGQVRRHRNIKLEHSEDKSNVIFLSDEQLEKLKEVLENHWDKGPEYEGWQSEELQDLREYIEGI